MAYIWHPLAINIKQYFMLYVAHSLRLLPALLRYIIISVLPPQTRHSVNLHTFKVDSVPTAGKNRIFDTLNWVSF